VEGSERDKVGARERQRQSWKERETEMEGARGRQGWTKGEIEVEGGKRRTRKYCTKAPDRDSARCTAA
jgi:hypothetical protein